MPERRSGSYSVGVQRRQKILDVASHRFATDGYHATSMGAIAAEVGISDSGINHHFPTKRHLLLAVAEKRIDDTAKEWESHGPEVVGLAALDATVTGMKRMLAQPGLIELFVSVISDAGDSDGPAFVPFRTRYSNAFVGIRDRLVPGVANGEIRPDVDLLDIARECVAVTDGLQFQWVLSGGKLDIVRAMSSYVERVKASIRA